LGSRGRKMEVWGCPGQKLEPNLKNKLKSKRTGRPGLRGTVLASQARNPEFNYQYPHPPKCIESTLYIKCSIVEHKMSWS
jgi:hypothetical protein